MHKAHEPDWTPYEDGDVPETRLIAARAALSARAAELRAQRSQLHADWRSIVDATELSATDDEHDPEGATIAYERSRVAALAEGLAGEQVAIELALKRVQEGTYGQCLMCGQPIEPERLAARPAAERCMGCVGRPTPLSELLHDRPDTPGRSEGSRRSHALQCHPVTTA